MKTAHFDSAQKFDTSRAHEYAQQSRIALAGYDACHELSACMLAATLGSAGSAKILVVGAGGTAGEILAMAALEPQWRFTAVDPSEPMLGAAIQQLRANDVLGRTDVRLGTIDDLPTEELYDAATLIGVLHHVEGHAPKQHLLRSIRDRLKPGAPLILAGNHYAYASQPLLLDAWAQRWRQHGASPDEVKAKLARILQGADPPESESAVQELLHDSGFADATRFFSSLFWGAWLTRKAS